MFTTSMEYRVGMSSISSLHRSKSLHPEIAMSISLRSAAVSFILSGTTAKFSITMDLAWKVMKDIIVGYYEITDFVTVSPKEVLKKAFQAKLISDDAWLEMLRIRNELTHDYDGAIIKSACMTIIGRYLDLFLISVIP